MKTFLCLALLAGAVSLGIASESEARGRCGGGRAGLFKKHAQAGNCSAQGCAACDASEAVQSQPVKKLPASSIPVRSNDKAPIETETQVTPPAIAPRPVTVVETYPTGRFARRFR